MPYKPKVLVDFDGPIHKYSRGWLDGTAYDGPTEGSKEALEAMEEVGFDVVIFSSRDAEQIREWLALYGYKPYRVTNVKEPALCQIDDRAIRWINWDQSINDLSILHPIKES
jgi:hypothetical protein